MVQLLAAASSSMRSSCASLDVTLACQLIPRPRSARMTSLSRSSMSKKSASLIEIMREPQFSTSWITSSTGRSRNFSPFMRGSAQKMQP
jgi:hypothetical protein